MEVVFCYMYIVGISGEKWVKVYRFIGRYENSIDEKGRVAVPSRFRRGLNGFVHKSFVVCLAPEKRLRLYPLEIWLEKEKGYLELPSTRENRRFLRAMYQSVEEVELDGQGRIKIPSHLLFYAGVQNRLAFIGISAEQCLELCVPALLEEPSQRDLKEMCHNRTNVGVSYE